MLGYKPEGATLQIDKTDAKLMTDCFVNLE